MSHRCYYLPQTKLREGNVFTGVCDSVYKGAAWTQGVAWSGGLVPGGSGPEGVPVGEPPPPPAARGTHPTGMHSCLHITLPQTSFVGVIEIF